MMCVEACVLRWWRLKAELSSRAALESLSVMSVCQCGSECACVVMSYLCCEANKSTCGLVSMTSALTLKFASSILARCISIFLCHVNVSVWQ